jgi:transposase
VDANPPDPLPISSNDPVVLKEMLLDLRRQLREQDLEIARLARKVEQLLRRIYGRRSERIDLGQFRLAFAEVMREPVAAGDIVPEELRENEAFLGTPAAVERKPRRPGHGRKHLPAHLERRRVVHELPDSELACPGCGATREKFGEEISEQLDFVPASLFVWQHVRFKYVCRGCEEHVATAAPAPKPIEKGIPGPGLLAQVLVGKFQDHLPLHRQVGIFRRHGVELSRSTLGDWVRDASVLLTPLVREMKREILESHVIGTDHTPVPVLDDDRGSTKLGRLWVYLGDSEHPYTVYDFSPDRSGSRPREWLGEYRGLVQADAYSGYDALFRVRPGEETPRMIEVGCMAHARRYFHNARATDNLRSLIALSFFKILYQVESEGRGLDPPARLELRRRKAVPWHNAFHVWLKSQEPEVLPKSPIGEAIHYAMAQWTALSRYLEDGALEIDNNRTERALRTVAVGRKSWGFAGSDAGGERAAVIYSVIESARRHGLEPFSYLKDLLERLPAHPQLRIAELLPNRWKAERAAAGTEQPHTA